MASCPAPPSSGQENAATVSHTGPRPPGLCFASRLPVSSSLLLLPPRPSSASVLQSRKGIGSRPASVARGRPHCSATGKNRTPSLRTPCTLPRAYWPGTACGTPQALLFCIVGGGSPCTTGVSCSWQNGSTADPLAWAPGAETNKRRLSLGGYRTVTDREPPQTCGMVVHFPSHILTLVGSRCEGCLDGGAYRVFLLLLPWETFRIG